MPARIEDYALVGDTHTAALISRGGSVDWLCVPRFDSGACFAALVGNDEHGHWLIAPTGPVRRTTRRYRDDTLVLETEHETADGLVRVVDCMPPRRHEADLFRIVEGVRGAVPMRMELRIRFDYGSVVPWVRRTITGLSAIAGPDALELSTDVPLQGRDFATFAEFTVREGQSVPFTLTWHPSTESAPPPLDARWAVAHTEQIWRDWSSRCRYRGEWREPVMRSLLTLKSLTYAPTGGIVAAATTSLPETLGGVRNWDYRYCWIRDATFTLYSLLLAGFESEAHAWRDWLVRAVAGKPSELQIVYGVSGERRLTELEVGWLPGYEGASPVRIGNAASEQFQLDVYGEVMDLLHQAAAGGMEQEESVWRVQRSLLDFLEGAWREPDEGIWEVRGPRRDFTHSKVMAWVAFDRAVRSVDAFGVDGPVDRWRAIRDEIHREACDRGFDADRNTFTQFYGSEHLDASLLMIPLVGFLPIEDERVQGTISAVRRELVRDGLVARYENDETIEGVPGREGAFLACTFWLVDCLALSGRAREARELFERLLALRNDVGLLSEEYDVEAGRMTGNFPQAFSHVSLIDSARNLSRTERGPADRRRRARDDEERTGPSG
jgi:GH15 family glucan-1,4-alpha-glucosidase